MPLTTRLALAALAAAVTLGTPARVARAQGTDPAQQDYKARREQLLKELEQTQQQLADIRSQRVQLQARIENVIAQMMQQRAQALLLSNEATALQQLDAMMTSSQDNLLAQRDRFLAIGDAVKRRSGAVLVVLLRADSSEGGGDLQTATLTVDNLPAESRTYTATANGALRMGAVDQLFRGNTLPAPHTVTLQLAAGGQTLSQSITVNAASESVTYVQFAYRNGQLAPTTWSSKGTTPF